MSGDKLKENVVDLLKKVRLTENYLYRFPRQLSGGEKQRIAVARAFAAKPDIILCDEVTSALDVSVQAAVLKLLQDLKNDMGTTYIFVSHDLAVVRLLADRIIVMQNGNVIEAGLCDQVLDDPQHKYSQLLVSSVLQV